MGQDKHDQQDNQDQNEAVKRRAYDLWLEEGRAHGRDQEHWRRAEEEIARAKQQAQSQPPNGNREAEVAPSTAPSAAPARSASSRPALAAPSRNAPKGPPPRGAKR